MNDLDIALDVSLIEQTTTHVEVTADCFRDRVRQLVWLLDCAYQLANADEHVEAVLSASLYIDVLHDDDDAAQLIRHIAKWSAEYARPDLFAVGAGVEHLAAGTH